MLVPSLVMTFAVRNALLLLPFFFCPLAQADRLWLEDGDQLTGKILFMADGKLAFDANATGRVDIPWKKIVTLASDDPVRIDLKGESGEVLRLAIAAGDPGMVRVGGNRMIAVADIQGLLRAREIRREWLFEGNLDVATDIKRQRDDNSNNIDARIDTRILDFDWRHVLKGEYTYETEEDVEAERNYTAEYNLDYFFGHQWYWRVHALAERDYFDNDKRDNEYGSGPGYQFWDDEQGRFGVNLNVLHYRYARHYEDDELAYLNELSPLSFNALGFEWDFKQSLYGTDVEIFTTGSFIHPDFYDIDYLVKSDSGVRYHLNGRVNLSVNVEHDEVKTGDFTDSSNEYTFGIGVDW